MPVVNKPVQGLRQRQYRRKFGNAGGLRDNEDFSQVMLHFNTQNIDMLVHEQSMFDHVVIEIHNGMNETHEQELEVCESLSIGLTPQQRYDLAIYLLATVNVIPSRW